MDKIEAYTDFLFKKGPFDKPTEEELFFAGWDACEDTWLTNEPDKDLMISELESELECAKNKNYEKEYISLYKRSTRYLSILAQISKIQGSDKLSETEKLRSIRNLLDYVSSNNMSEVSEND